jgi:hypothetical protein
MGAERTETGSLSPDSLFETLSNHRRRHVLYYLKYVDTSATIRELSEQLAAWENGIERARVTPKERKRLYTALHQTHLPKMDRLGIIDYDASRGTIEMVDSLEQFDVYFGENGTDGLRWCHLYLGLGALSAVVAGLAFLLGPAVLGGVGGYGFALLTGALLTVVAAYHAVRERSQGTSTVGLSVPGERAVGGLDSDD